MSRLLIALLMSVPILAAGGVSPAAAQDNPDAMKYIRRVTPKFTGSVVAGAEPQQNPYTSPEWVMRPPRSSGPYRYGYPRYGYGFGGIGYGYGPAYGGDNGGWIYNPKGRDHRGHDHGHDGFVRTGPRTFFNPSTGQSAIAPGPPAGNPITKPYYGIPGTR